MPAVATARYALNNSPYYGDICAHWQIGEKWLLCVVDGLGHGEEAEKAARAAIDYVDLHRGQPLQEIFTGGDAALRHTRGVVMGIAEVDPVSGSVTYAGIGNIRIVVFGDKLLHLSNRYSILGAGIKAPPLEAAPYRKGDLVVMYTDGIKENVDLLRYNPGMNGDIQKLAEAILEDYGVTTDDAAVLVFREEVTA